MNNSGVVPAETARFTAPISIAGIVLLDDATYDACRRGTLVLLKSCVAATGDDARSAVVAGGTPGGRGGSFFFTLSIDVGCDDVFVVRIAHDESIVGK